MSHFNLHIWTLGTFGTNHHGARTFRLKSHFNFVHSLISDELFEEGDVSNKQPVLLREDLMSNPNNGVNESLLLQRPTIQIDPYGRGSLGRPTPAYQRRQL